MWRSTNSTGNLWDLHIFWRPIFHIYPTLHNGERLFLQTINACKRVLFSIRTWSAVQDVSFVMERLWARPLPRQQLSPSSDTRASRHSDSSNVGILPGKPTNISHAWKDWSCAQEHMITLWFPIVLYWIYFYTGFQLVRQEKEKAKHKQHYKQNRLVLMYQNM